MTGLKNEIDQLEHDKKSLAEETVRIFMLLEAEEAKVARLGRENKDLANVNKMYAEQRDSAVMMLGDKSKAVIERDDTIRTLRAANRRLTGDLAEHGVLEQ